MVETTPTTTTTKKPKRRHVTGLTKKGKTSGKTRHVSVASDVIASVKKTKSIPIQKQTKEIQKKIEETNALEDFMKDLPFWVLPLAVGTISIALIYFVFIRRDTQKSIEDTKKEADSLQTNIEHRGRRRLEQRLDKVNLAEQEHEAKEHHDKFHEKPIDELTNASTVIPKDKSKMKTVESEPEVEPEKKQVQFDVVENSDSSGFSFIQSVDLSNLV